MAMTQQNRIRRSSVESPPVSLGNSCCYPDTIAGPYSSSFDQDTLSLLLAASAQTGFGPGGASTGPPSKAHMPFLAPAMGPPATASASGSYDPSMMESEEPGPLPFLPRTRALGSGGPYGSSSAALMRQQQQQPGSYGGHRQGRPRRHSVTLGMLNEHQQQQQAAAYAAALAAAQQSSFAGGGMPGQHGANGLGMLGQLPQVQQQPQAVGGPSPSKQHLQALNNVQAMAAAAQLGMGTNPLLASLALQQPDQFASQLARSSGSSVLPPGAGELTDLEAQYNLNGPRLPNAGGWRRHSWAPTGLNGSTAYAQALLLQQQLQLAAAAAAMGDARGLLGLNGMHTLGQQKGLGGVARQAPAAYGNDSSYLNGHPPNGSGPPSTAGFAGLSSAAAAAAAAMAQLSSMQSAGALAGFDAATNEQQLQRLLQLQQQASLAAGQPMLDPYMEAVLEAGQGLGPSAAAVLPCTAPMGALPGGLLPGGVGATTHLTQLGLDSDSLSPAAAAAAASMYAPLKVNGVTLDSQLLVAPFADNWDVMCVQGQAGVTPQQLAATAVLNGQRTGYGVITPGASPAAAQSAAGMHTKLQKGLPARSVSGSCGSSSSSGSTNGTVHHPSTTAPVPSAHVGTNSNGKGSTVANSGNSAGAAAALAAASAVAAAPLMANVCSDAPWDLKKAAEEDAKVLAAQEGRVQRLMSALERSQTLAKVHAAQAASKAAAPAAASDAADSNSRDCSQPVLFGYKLADTGADAWGGSSSSAALENAPGSGCISQEPSNKLFVGNIGWWVTEEDLLHWFSRFGTVVHVKIMYNSRKMHKPKDKWRSREYGFIDYATPEEAAKAIVWMDGVELPDLMKDTCGIIVQYAKPTGTPCSGSGNGSGSGSGSGTNPHSAECAGSHTGTANGYSNGVTAV